METEEDILNPTDAMKRHQLESWTQRRRPRGGDPIPLGDVLTSIPGTETDEDRQRQRKARSALLQDPARLERLFKVDFTEAARSQFEDQYGSDPRDWTATIRRGRVAYGLNPNNFPLTA